MGQPNAICSDSGTHVSITSLEECQNAVPFIESKFPGIATQVNTQQMGQFPTGCILPTTIGIYFNTHTFGEIREQNSREVCIAKGK